MIIASVLKTGGEYVPEHVYNLRDMCKDFMPAHQFVCLTDATLKGTDSAPLEHGWKGWWSKLELFKLQGPCLYLDLDTILVSDCTPLVDAAKDKSFVVLRDFYRGYTLTPINPKAIGSGMMYWKDSMRFLYESYLQSSVDYDGDQDFIEHAMQGKEVHYWQDLCTGVVSYKAHNRNEIGLQLTDKVICFHGKPRPWEQSVISYPFRKELA